MNISGPHREPSQHHVPVSSVQGMQHPDPEADKSLDGSSQRGAQRVRIPPLEKRKPLDEKTHLLCK